MHYSPLAVALLWLAPRLIAAQVASAPPQTESDEYTRYELLAPGSGRFRILYEVTATTPGATAYFNPIRAGSVASDEAVYDRMTGRALAFEVVSGAVARAGGVADADTATSYIRVALPRPVPREGEVRLLIDKTYTDPKSYYEREGVLTFSRSLGIKRNAVVLPAGYELIGCNYPSQVLTQTDGRIAISFVNVGPAPVPLELLMRRIR
jgi:hypothetical protein